MMEVLRALPEAMHSARAAYSAAVATLHDASTDDEWALCQALELALAGCLLAAADVLDRQLTRRPHNLAFIKLSTMLRFVGGDVAGMRRATMRAVASWSAAQPGYGFVLGCHAFALEETGDFAAAERAGRDAVGYEPADAWAIHAVAHVHEMTGRRQDGIDWLERCRADWRGCNNFAFHLSWHLALFHLEAGDHERVLEIYDREVRAVRSEEYRDVANATSLLWRLRQDGVEVGGRWAELAEIARRRRHEAGLLFADLHRLLALVAVGDRDAARDCLGALAGARGEQGALVACCGTDLARGLMGLPVDGLDQVASSLDGLGGSHAQRDVFMRSLALAARSGGDDAALRRIMALRHRLRAGDRFRARLS
jgi:tetratricopeptide (TPR) repeat protein